MAVGRHLSGGAFAAAQTVPRHTLSARLQGYTGTAAPATNFAAGTGICPAASFNTGCFGFCLVSEKVINCTMRIFIAFEGSFETFDVAADETVEAVKLMIKVVSWSH